MKPAGTELFSVFEEDEEPRTRTKDQKMRASSILTMLKFDALPVRS